MHQLHILFSGAQVYVPKNDSSGRLEIYMPNATKMGNSPQHSLAMHMPTLCLLDPASLMPRKIEKMRLFPWSKMTFDFKSSSLPEIDHSALAGAGGDPEDRMALSADRLADPQFLASQVTLQNGRVSLFEVGDPTCTFQDWSSTAPSYPDTSVINRVHVFVDNLTDDVEINFSTLLASGGEVPTPVTLKMGDCDFNKILFIGNVCARSLLRWAENEAIPYTDEDFWWLYQLVDPAPVGKPLPILEQQKTPISSTSTPKLVLENIELGGGGGVGCECMGCIGETS